MPCQDLPESKVMSSLVRIKWPSDTPGQLKAFRSELGIVAIGSFVLGFGMVILTLHHNPAFSHLLGVVFLGSLLGSWWTIAKPTNPFRKHLFAPRPLADLDEPALRVLSFLRSTKAAMFSILTGLIIATLIFGATILDWSMIKGLKSIAWERDRNWTISIIAITTLMFYVIPLHVTQEMVLHIWIARRYDKILSSYEPWPKDKTF